jgi:23S rRNA pseudouridine2604 synthase
MLGSNSIYTHSIVSLTGLEFRQPSPLPFFKPRSQISIHRRRLPTTHHVVHLLPRASLQSEQGDAQPPASQPTVRINKCFREFASRREADRYVEDGRVMVNGIVAVSGQRVQPGDRVTLDGREVQWEMLAAEIASIPSTTATSALGSINNSNPTLSFDNSSGDGISNTNILEDDGSEKLPLEDRFYYIKYWKPRGVVCTCDRSIRGNILDSLPRPPPGVRLFTVGRLDKDSTGLILLTSDGRLPNASLRSKEGHPKVYRVTADRPIPDQDCGQLASGVVITTVAQRDRGVAKELTAPTLPCRLKRDGEGGRRILIELREGRNRQIRRMLHALGYDTMELHRVSFMGIGLDGVREGEWKPLSEEEMQVLRKAVRAAEAKGSNRTVVEVEQLEDVEMQ